MSTIWPSTSRMVNELVAVKGIGEWTAHMFLMFCIARSNILPFGDLGVRNGIQKLYAIPIMPDKAAIESIACWYIWQSLDNVPINTPIKA